MDRAERVRAEMFRPEMVWEGEGSALAVRTRDLAKRFKKRRALAGLDLCVPEGSVYVLVGPNGAGKTTALRLLLGLARPEGGNSRVFGLDSHRQSAEVRAAIGYVPESHRTPYGEMKVEALLAHLAAYRPTWDGDYATRLVAELELRRQARYGELSKGEARRVQLVAALAHRPPLLLLDEPTDGLDPVMRDRFSSLLADHLAGSETTVILSTHVVQETELLASHLGVLADGRLRAQVDTATLEDRLRRYRAVVPADSSDRDLARNTGLGCAILDRRDARGEIDWVVWGDEEEVLHALRTAGAETRQVRRLGLSEAARILIRVEEESSGGEPS